MVSVVMTTFNGAKYIEKQLDTIRLQSQKPDEVIICDDCSTDSTVIIINQYIERYKLTEWKIIKNEKNLGYFDNFFKGISLTVGDTIYLSDQDDMWDLNKIETFECLYKENPILTMIQSYFKFIDDNGVVQNSKEKYHGVVSGVQKYLTVNDMCKFAGSGFTMSFRKSVSKRIFDLGLHERKDLFEFHDILLGLIAASLGDCLLAGYIVDSHRIHENNVTKKKNKNALVGRSKKMQMDILKRRSVYFYLIAQKTPEQDKSVIYKRYADIARERWCFLESFGFKRFIRLILNRNMYASKFGVVTDVMYSIGLEKILLRIYSRLK